MDIIYLHDLAVDCVIGAWDWEREITQTVYIDLDMAWDIQAAGASDDLDDTLSYKDVSKAVSALVIERQFKLVEAMAEDIAALLLDQFKVPWCRVRINKKGAVRDAQDVGVIIERAKTDEARKMTRVAVGIGSNIDREANVRFAIAALRDRFGDIEISPVYESASVGFDGPDFYNLVVVLQADESVDGLKTIFNAIEAKAGRVRDTKTYGSRTLDIDILLYGDADLRKEGRNIPRDEIIRAAYVLRPLADLLPDDSCALMEGSFSKAWSQFEGGCQTLATVVLTL